MIAERFEWRLTWRQERGLAYQARIVTAATLDEAIAAIGPYFSIRRITVRCNATTKQGGRCQAWTITGRCPNHTTETT